MKVRISILAFALAASCALTAMAQDKIAGPTPNGAPKLVIESLTHDFGEVKAGEPLGYQFKVKNEGTADLLIKSVTPG